MTNSDQGRGFRVMGFLGKGFRVMGFLGFRVEGFGSRAEGLGFWASWGLGLKVSGSGLRV